MILASSVAWHENVRLMVAQLLLKTVDSLIEKRLRLHGPDPKLMILKAFSETFINNPERVVILMSQEVYVSPGRKHRVS